MQEMGALERNRTIQLKIKGQAINIDIKDPTTEWDLRLMARLKDASLGAPGGLTPMVHETWLMDLEGQAQSPVPKDIIASMQAARSCAQEVLGACEMECFADIQRATTTKQMWCPCQLLVHAVIVCTPMLMLLGLPSAFFSDALLMNPSSLIP
jgi:hypothetical protein